jgi:hypothetical protein
MFCQIDGPHGGLPLFWPWSVRASLEAPSPPAESFGGWPLQLAVPWTRLKQYRPWRA